MSENNGVDVIDPTERALARRQDLNALAVKFMQSARSASDMSPEDAELAIINAILAGETVDEIFGDVGNLLQMEAYENRRITIHGWRWQRSDFEGFPVYMVLDITDEGSDEHQAMGCGAKVCMAQVFAADAHELLPVDVFVKKAPKPTKKGFYPYRFLNAPVEESF